MNVMKENDQGNNGLTKKIEVVFETFASNNTKETF